MLREFITTRPVLQEMIKGAFLTETKGQKIYKTLSKLTYRNKKMQLYFRIVLYHKG